MRGSTVNFLVLKIAFPVVLFGMYFLPMNATWPTAAFVILLPLPLIATFYAVAAQIQPNNDAVRFRRFLRWNILSLDEIESASVSFLPSLGVIKLKNRPFFSRRLYFIIEENGVWLPGQVTPLMSGINKKKTVDFPTSGLKAAGHISFRVVAILFLAGFLLGVAVNLTTLRAGYISPPDDVLRHYLPFLSRSWSKPLSFMALAIGVFCTRRDRIYSGALSALLGFFVASVLWRS